MSIYKQIFIDIDRTLLTSHHTISKGTYEVLNRIINDNNIPVILTTARPPQAVKKIYNQLKLLTPVSCFNGALIIDSLNNNNYKILQSINISNLFLSKISSIAQLHNLNICIYKLEEWYTNKKDKWTDREENNTACKSIFIHNFNLKLKNWQLENFEPNKILLMGDAEQINIVLDKLNNEFKTQLNIFKSNKNYLEISNITASKKTAIEFLIKKNKIKKEQTIAIGDNFNDIEMIKFAGLGIAMGNAPEQVKQFANFVTLDNNSEGIKFALDKFILR